MHPWQILYILYIVESMPQPNLKLMFLCHDILMTRLVYLDIHVCLSTSAIGNNMRGADNMSIYYFDTTS